MIQPSRTTHLSHKLLLLALLLVACGVPFVAAGNHSNLSHDSLLAGGGVLSSSQDSSPTTVRQTPRGVTVSTVAGQGLVSVPLK